MPQQQKTTKKPAELVELVVERTLELLDQPESNKQLWTPEFRLRAEGKDPNWEMSGGEMPDSFRPAFGQAVNEFQFMYDADRR